MFVVLPSISSQVRGSSLLCRGRHRAGWVHCGVYWSYPKPTTAV